MVLEHFACGHIGVYILTSNQSLICFLLEITEAIILGMFVTKTLKSHLFKRNANPPYNFGYSQLSARGKTFETASANGTGH